MKLKDILTEEGYKKYGDLSVYNDCTDEEACSWCGTLLTDYGKEVYVNALELEADIEEDNNWANGNCIVVHINDLPSGEDEFAWEEVCCLFNDAAGYIPDKDYRKRFVTEDKEEPAPIENPDEIIHDLKCKLNRAIGVITNPFTDDKEQLLKYLGLTDKEIKDWLY